MFPRALRIGSIRGIDVRVDPSWLVIALLVTWSFWAYFADRLDHPSGSALPMAVAAALLFFGSVLVHELGHALEAKHRGVQVGGITLFLFGGVTETKFDVRRPFDEFALSAVGPYVSFVAAAACGLVATYAARAGLAPVADVVGLIGWLNLVLGVFNLLPGAPLDGGRVLRSIVWAVTSDRLRSIRVAARAGQVVGMLIVGFGIWFLFLPGGSVQGIWLLLIGWFMLQGAKAELAHSEVQAVLEGRTAGSIAGPLPSSLRLDAPLSVVEVEMARSPADAFPVSDWEGRTVGVVRLADVAAVPERQRPYRSVQEIMGRLDEIPTIDAGMDATGVVERLSGETIVAVVEDGEVVGLLTPQDLVTIVRRVRTLRGPRRRGAPTR